MIVEADEVVDRLECGAGLAPAIREHVELGLELLVAGQVEAGAAGIGVDLACPVVDRGERPVVDAGADQVLDPVLVGDPEGLDIRGRVLRVRALGACLRPLLGEALHPPVERRDDRVAAGVDRGAVVGERGGAEDLAELVADLEHELGREPALVRGRRDDDRLLHRGVVVGGRVRAGGEHAARLHQAQDVVAALDDRRVRRAPPAGPCRPRRSARRRSGPGRTPWGTGGSPRGSRPGPG